MTLLDEELKQFLVKRTNEVWAESQYPYFLARVQPELRAEGKDYREVTGTTLLSSYVENVPGVRLVRHPHQKAKIGLVPATSSFAFPDVEEATGRAVEIVPRAASSTTMSGRKKKSERVLLEFLYALSRLDEDDLEGFSIPARVISKLLRD